MRDDRPHDECGVYGVYGDPSAARLTYFGLYTLQHRGQESAGIAVSDGEDVRHYKAMGLVSQVFDENILQQLSGHIACGHNRYSTTGSSVVSNAQPVWADCRLGKVFVCHNGNLTNTDQLRDIALANGVTLQTTSDSELIAVLIALSPGSTWVEKIEAALARLVGAYSLVIMTKNQLFAVKDPHGIRPLSLGRIKGRAWVVASETCALDVVGAGDIQELQPGELIIIDSTGVTSRMGTSGTETPCSFEHIYLARADSVIGRKAVYDARYAMGVRLAQRHPAHADLVIPVPNTAIPAAQGYAHESGLVYQDGLVPNRYIHRTFIQPDQQMRANAVRMKFNPIPSVLMGKRVVVVDDSIVRGTSQQGIVALLRRAKVREIHLRICAPPLRHPCFLGVDMATYGELIAHRLDTIERIRDYLGVDSLGYLETEDIRDAMGNTGKNACTACFDGVYPVPVSHSVAEQKELTLA